MIAKDKPKLTVVLPKQLQIDMRAAITSNGYTLREKSKWVEEAITTLLELDNYPDLVHYADELVIDEKKVETFQISPTLKPKLNRAILAIRQKYPTIEGVQSLIVRTGILQRILRS